jgi:hypothetical protein
MKVGSLSALCTCRIYSPGNTPGTHFCYRMNRPQCHNAAGKTTSMKRKSPMTLSEIQPATFRLIAQYLNQLHHRLAVLIFNAQKYRQGTCSYFYKKSRPLQIFANSPQCVLKYCSYIQIQNRSYSCFYIA